MMIQMAILRPSSREAIIVDKYRFVGDKGVVLNENDYSPHDKLLRRDLEEMVEGVYPMMKEYLRGNKLGEFDQLAFDILLDEELRKELAKEMLALIPKWGGYLPVMDRCLDETILVVLETEPEELNFFVLARHSFEDCLGWYKLKDLWPMVMYAYWKKHSDSTHINGKDELPRED